ncbi:uncharacterized protein LOC107668272 [Sinocyclocheilus anshuiensis]|uniref:uncharacterized protein LOC107668272 n=1 Tax=Sinocyclocheilus anshuiensis TaxID=1608454 RepID=UPI0007BA1B5E|nr:PREDICTED: uncharacterized protein LOC107668272 [Sinocyclocheilus anshuiensis]
MCTCTAFKIKMLNPAEVSYLSEYCIVMKLVSMALNILQSETNTQMGWLLPTICLLDPKLKKMEASIKVNMHKEVMFFPGKVKVVLRKGPLGYHLQEPTDEASLIKSNPSLQDKSAPMKQDLVRQHALTVVRQRGGDASDKREVLGEYILQFGKYKGKSFRWLLENDMGYTIYLMKTLQQEEAAGEFRAEGHSKHSLVSFVNYAHSFEEIESPLSYVSTTPAAPAASSEDDQNYKSTWQEIWKSRADGYASCALGATCVPGTRMHKLQQYLRKQQQSTCRPVPTSSAITLPISHLLFSRKYCHCINSYKQIT